MQTKPLNIEHLVHTINAVYFYEPQPGLLEVKAREVERDEVPGLKDDDRAEDLNYE